MAIELTVALPMFKAKNIGWLSIESLCRQRNSNGCDWELIVAEEIDKKYSPFTKTKLLSYKSRLEKVRCKKITYIPLNTWEPLPKKWRLISDYASDTSKIFVLQAADCYSHPWRIIHTWRAFSNNKDVDWFQRNKGIFYDINTNVEALFFQSTKRSAPMLDMAVKIDYIKKLGVSSRKRGIDGWIFNSCISFKKRRLKILYEGSNSYKYGFDSNGFNTISSTRLSRMRKKASPFKKVNFEWKHNIPSDIWNKFKKLKER